MLTQPWHHQQDLECAADLKAVEIERRFSIDSFLVLDKTEAEVLVAGSRCKSTKSRVPTSPKMRAKSRSVTAKVKPPTSSLRAAPPTAL